MRDVTLAADTLQLVMAFCVKWRPLANSVLDNWEQEVHAGSISHCGCWISSESLFYIFDRMSHRVSTYILQYNHKAIKHVPNLTIHSVP